MTRQILAPEMHGGRCAQQKARETASTDVSRCAARMQFVIVQSLYPGSSIPTAQLGFHALAQVQKRRRRHRTVFTELQLRDLENLFNKTSYPDTSTREKLAQSTHLSQETIKVWFKNRRAKVRKQRPPLLGQLDSSSECNGSETVSKCLKQFVHSDSES
ncbi:homeobox protein goosecoid-like [Mustelus asterias]